jgi:hypothetical protein
MMTMTAIHWDMEAFYVKVFLIVLVGIALTGITCLLRVLFKLVSFGRRRLDVVLTPDAHAAQIAEAVLGGRLKLEDIADSKKQELSISSVSALREAEDRFKYLWAKQSLIISSLKKLALLSACWSCLLIAWGAANIFSYRYMYFAGNTPPDMLEQYTAAVLFGRFTLGLLVTFALLLGLSVMETILCKRQIEWECLCASFIQTCRNTST